MRNDYARFVDAFDILEPFSGDVPKGFLVDFIGALTDGEFRTMWGIDPETIGGGHMQTALPDMTWGEGWFEAVGWLEAAKAAKDRYVMVTLGACYGAQAVGAYKMLQAINPMPAKLVAVEAEPTNYEWVVRHFQDNGIDPKDQWIIKAAIGADNEPILFPIGAPGSGAGNCISTNETLSRDIYANQLIAGGNTKDALRNLIQTGSTGLQKDLVPGYDFKAEIKFVSAVTLGDVLGPFDVVDYLESDIQQSEIIVFPPCMDILKRKVRRVHIGTHGKDVHAELLALFEADGWDIVFDVPPNTEHFTQWGNFNINDGILHAVNPTV
ncbi:MAG: FkbM family methyltransferase [Alphaproteobacteria bacterium]|nr:FkbM family methyltransferase [Alphaproteobacteria bacterium]